MDLGLQGKVALVTAASDGLGKAIAQMLAQEGAETAICARRQPQLEQTAADLHASTGRQVLPIVADVSRPEDVKRLVDRVAEHFGRIDILVINAGGPPPGNFVDLDESAWRRGLDVTLMSAVNLCYGVLPHMREAGGGRIVAVTSVSVKNPLRNLTLSNSIRAAVVGLTKSLSIELAPYGILVNSVLPGWTATDRVVELMDDRARRNGLSREAVQSEIVADIPLKRLGRPHELAALVAFLSSSCASYITGTAIPVDGGTIRTPF